MPKLSRIPGQNGDWTDMVTVGGITQEFEFKKYTRLPQKALPLKASWHRKLGCSGGIGYLGRAFANLLRRRGRPSENSSEQKIR